MALSSSSANTCALLIINTDVFTGKLKESYYDHIYQRLFDAGIVINRITVLKENINEIVNELRFIYHPSTYIIIIRTLKPSNDVDVTLKAVAIFLNQPLIFNDILLSKFDDEKTFLQESDLEIQMARLPGGCELIYPLNPESNSPCEISIIRIKNLYIFPSVPEIFKKLFDLSYEFLFTANRECDYQIMIKSEKDKSSIIDAIMEISVRWSEVYIDAFSISTTEEKAETKIIVSYNNKTIVNAVKNDILLVIGDNTTRDECFYYKTADINNKVATDDFQMSVNDVYISKNFVPQIAADVSSQLREKLDKSVAILNQCIDLFSKKNAYCLCFNGGKDCTLILHLMVSLLKYRNMYSSSKFQILFIEDRDQFQEVKEFIEQSTKEMKVYHIKSKGSIKDGLKILRSMHPHITACVTGARYSDPKGKSLKSFIETDPSWPAYVRVNPILQWTYKDVWEYIMRNKLPYCKLYDMGYSSLGSPLDTKPNPLLVHNGTKSIDFLPAYELCSEKYERHGRM